MTTRVEFGGFYETSHSDKIDEALDGIEFDTEKYDEAIKVAKKEYCKNYIDFLNEELDTKLVYIGLEGPMFYNYSTDEIVAEYKDDDYKKIVSYTQENFYTELEEEIVDRTTHRAGYTPFYTYKELKENKDMMIAASIRVIIEFFESEDRWEQYFDFNCIFDDIRQ